VRFKTMEIAIAEYISKKGMSKKGGSSRCPSHRVFGTTLAGNRSLSFRATLKRLELRAGAKRAGLPALRGRPTQSVISERWRTATVF
jgi:hypothetical protein